MTKAKKNIDESDAKVEKKWVSIMCLHPGYSSCWDNRARGFLDQTDALAGELPMDARV